MRLLRLLALGVLASGPALAQTQCFGEHPYRVCTETRTSPSGDVSIRSYDSTGNSYSVDTTTQRLPGGGNEVISRDSTGNSYSVRSWCDAGGCHSQDSMGNRCTITRTGRQIGC